MTAGGGMTPDRERFNVLYRVVAQSYLTRKDRDEATEALNKLTVALDAARDERDRYREALSTVLDCPDCGGGGYTSEIVNGPIPNNAELVGWEPQYEPVECGCREEARAALAVKEKPEGAPR